jgi:hypothetical protein
VNAAEKWAALKALADAIYTAAKAAEPDVLDIADGVGVKTFETPFGQVTIVRPGESIVVDERALLGMVDPTELEQRVAPWKVKELTSRLVIVAGEVVDKTTGEVVEWAHVQPGGDPQVRWPSTTQQKQVKERAREFIAGTVDDLTAGLREITS